MKISKNIIVLILIIWGCSEKRINNKVELEIFKKCDIEKFELVKFYIDKNSFVLNWKEYNNDFKTSKLLINDTLNVFKELFFVYMIYNGRLANCLDNYTVKYILRYSDCKIYVYRWNKHKNNILFNEFSKDNNHIKSFINSYKNSRLSWVELKKNIDEDCYLSGFNDSINSIQFIVMNKEKSFIRYFSINAQANAVGCESFPLDTILVYNYFDQH